MRRKVGLVVTTALASGICATASAQTYGPPPVAIVDAPPQVMTTDHVGVDIISRRLNVVLGSVTIGPEGPGNITYVWGTSDAVQGNTNGFVKVDPTDASKYSVVIAGSSEVFILSGALGTGTFAPQLGSPATLTYDAASKTYTYTTANGVISTFKEQPIAGGPVVSTARIVTMLYPTGEKLDYTYYVDGSNYALRSVVNNLGHQLRIEQPAAGQTKVVGFNMNFVTCNPAAATCAVTGNWPTLTISGNQATDEATRTTSVSSTPWVPAPAAPDAFGIWTSPYSESTYTITRPSGRQATYVFRHVTGSNPDPYPYRVREYSDGVATHAYSVKSSNPSFTEYQAFYPAGRSRVVSVNSSDGTIKLDHHSSTNSPTQYFYTNGRLSAVENYSETQTLRMEYTYDSRGNVTSTRKKAVGTSLPDIVTSATYPPSCTPTTLATCNKPLSTTDAHESGTQGRVTTYAYSSVHGGVTSITRPAQTGTGLGPVTTYTYTTRTANYRNPAGTVIQGTPVHRLQTIDACQNTVGCAATDKTFQAFEYDSNNGLAMFRTTRRNSTSTLGQTVTYSFLPRGLISFVDGPLAGTADRVFNYYDTAGQLTGQIGVDPDGTGPRKFLAQRFSYDPDGNRTATEVGTTTAANVMTSFAPVLRSDVTYNAQGRPVRETSSGNGATFSVTDVSYRNDGLLECSAVRMNPATFASPPTAACALTTEGADGLDRITKQSYDAMGRPTSTITSFGTSDQKTIRSATYNALGQVKNETDGNNNTTSYSYDEFMRPKTVCYPTSPASCETVNYNPSGTISSRILRDGSTISHAYNNWDLETSRDLPVNQGWETDLAFGYDLLGRMTTMTHVGPNHTYTMAYNVLDQLVSQTTGWHGNASFTYDAAGRRTQLKWTHDNLAIDYNYDVAGNVTAIRENGAMTGPGVLATYSYDDLGRRTSRVHGNGTATYYGFDTASRLNCLTLDLTGGGTVNCTPTATGADHAATFSYNAAGQIKSTSRANDAYAWSGHANGTTAYGTNSLNQYTSVAGLAHSYDLRGNLTSAATPPSSGAGTLGFEFTKQNQLSRTTINSGQSPITLGYDPLGRLFNVNATQGPSSNPALRMNRVLMYDGLNLIAETNGDNSTLLRRYVHGPGVDEPIVWYEGSGTSDRRWMHADERGSIVVVTNGAGSAMGINSYDEYGVPRNSQSTDPNERTVYGRFGYTGQAWLPEVGLYHYKARAYSPTLGRFLQTDPIGYADGMNWYNYVGGDPVNNRDPSGLACFGGPAAGDCSVNEVPTDSAPIYIQNGQLGYYVSDGKGNATFHTIAGLDVADFTKHLGIQFVDGSSTLGQVAMINALKMDEIIVTADRKKGSGSSRWIACAADVGIGALEGFGYSTVAQSLFDAYRGTYDRAHPDDNDFKFNRERSSARITRGFSSSFRIGTQRLGKTLLLTNPYARAATTLVGAGISLVSSENCGLGWLAPPVDGPIL